MTNIHRPSGVVVDGDRYEGEPRSEPQWGKAESRMGMTGALQGKHTQHGRLQISDATAIREFGRPCRRGGSLHHAASLWSSWSMRMAIGALA